MNMNVMRVMLSTSLALLVLACGGDESMASKSAEAYREAQAKGIALGGGHDHGGHQTATATSATAAMDHAAHGTGADPHAGHDMTSARVTDHGAHRTMPASDHAAMGHEMGGDAHKGHAPASGTAMDHGGGAHEQHGSTVAPGADPHAQHTMRGGTPATPIITSAPSSNAEMRNVSSASTLQPDSFDSPAPISASEAAKATSGGGHQGHEMGDTAQPVVYTCPMHPEVTSDKAGTCPKCGMALVRKP